MKCILFILLFSPLVTVSQKYSPEFFTNILTKVSITEKCQKQFNQFIINLDKKKSWARQMIDANSKIPMGEVTLQFVDIGDFQGCIDAVAFDNGTRDILGKYCLGYVSVNNETSLQVRDYVSLISPIWSICVPNACTTEDTNIIGNKILTNLLEDDKIRVDFSDLLCQTIEEAQPELTLAAIIAIVILGLVVLVVFSATLYDFYKGNNILIVKAYSVYTNSRKIFRLGKSNPEHLPSLDGLRSISMIWVVAYHQYSIPTNGSIVNINSLVNWHHNFISMFITSGTIAVDSFLTIGGTLMSYGFLKARQNKVPFNLFWYYLHRYIRLSAAFLPVVLVSATLLKYFGSGPQWPYLVQYFQKNCEQNWWLALLYVQNYANNTKMCVGNSWYIDVDIQLCVLSPLVFYVLWKSPKCGLTLLGACALVSTGLSFYAIWENHLHALQFGVLSPRTSLYQTEYYLLTHTRATPWIIGVIIGYLIFTLKQKPIKFSLNRYVTLCIWTFCFGIILACTLGGYDILMHQIDGYDKWASPFYAALVRPAWSIAMGWIIVECTNNRGVRFGICLLSLIVSSLNWLHKRLVNWILSLPILRVLNTFAYSIYLVHVNVLFAIIYNQKWPIYYSDFNMAYKFWGTLFLSFGLSILIVFMAESPLITIENYLQNKFTKQRKEPEPDTENGVQNQSFEKSD